MLHAALPEWHAGKTVALQLHGLIVNVSPRFVLASVIVLGTRPTKQCV